MPHDGLLPIDREVLLEHLWQFDGDVGKHSIVGLPGFFGGVNVKAGAAAEIPAVLLTGNVAATFSELQINSISFMRDKKQTGAGVGADNDDAKGGRRLLGASFLHEIQLVASETR